MVCLYRLLRPEEEDFATDGLSAKDPNSTVNVNDHVTNGSRGPASSFISCCKSLEAVQNFASKIAIHPQIIVKIKIDENSLGVNVIDLTDPEVLAEHVYDDKGKNFAKYFEEVLIEGWIPPECISIVSIED